MSKFRKAVLGIFILVFIGGAVFPFVGKALADQERPILNAVKSVDMDMLVVQDNALLGNISHYYEKPTKKYWVVITGYSSDPLETDDTPFITASGQFVREGIVAANFLSFGTKIRIPSLFGDEIFVVEDRMNPRKKYHVDIWFPTKEEAIHFGAHKTYIEIID